MGKRKQFSQEFKREAVRLLDRGQKPAADHRVLQFAFAAFFLVFVAPESVRAQDSDAEYAERLRKADSLSVALGFKEMEDIKRQVELVRNSGMRLLVGKEAVTSANVDDFARRLDRRRQVLADEINRRGFVTVAGVYDLQKDAKNECRLPPEPWGPVTVTQDKYVVEFKASLAILSGKGVIVESSLAYDSAELLFGSNYAIVGVVANDGLEITFLDKIHRDSCKIGFLSKRGGLGGQ